MIVIVYWAVENNLVYFAHKRWLICDCVSFWAVEINLVYFAQKRRLICNCDSFSGLSYVEYY